MPQLVVFIAVATLFMFFGGGMLASDGMRGISWMWIPIFLPLGLGILFGWFIFGKNNQQ